MVMLNFLFYTFTTRKIILSEFTQLKNGDDLFYQLECKIKFKFKLDTTIGLTQLSTEHIKNYMRTMLHLDITSIARKLNNIKQLKKEILNLNDFYTFKIKSMKINYIYDVKKRKLKVKRIERKEKLKQIERNLMENDNISK